MVRRLALVLSVLWAWWALSDPSPCKRALAGWLRRPVWPANQLEAALLPWQYSRMPDGRYWTSPLGILNGVLPVFGCMLVTHHVDGTIERERRAWPTPASLDAPYLSFRRAGLS